MHCYAHRLKSHHEDSILGSYTTNSCVSPKVPQDYFSTPRIPSKTPLKPLTNDLIYAEEVDMKDALETLGIDHRLAP